MELLVIVAAVSTVGGTIIGWFGRSLSKTLIEYTGTEAPPPPARWGNREPHTHVYDTMLNDGKGWRCGVCGKIKQ